MRPEMAGATALSPDTRLVFPRGWTLHSCELVRDALKGGGLGCALVISLDFVNRDGLWTQFRLLAAGSTAESQVGERTFIITGINAVSHTAGME